MSLHIETGHPVTEDTKKLKEKTVRFVSDDGRTMFEVSACKDGRGIEIRGVDVTTIGGVVYSNLIDVRPNVANSITVRVRPYDDA